MTLNPHIEQLRFMQLNVPLEKPYTTANRVITSFQPFVVTARAGGVDGFGESLVLKGYTKEDPEASWLAGEALAKRIVGMRLDDATTCARELLQEHVGVASAMLCALDMVRGPGLLVSGKVRHVPLLATLSAETPEAISAEVEQRLAQGYRTFKAKVGFEPRADAQRINTMTAAIAGRAGLRIDANRAFSVPAALAFLQSLNGDGIDLFEQPCAADDWAAIEHIADRAHVPIMLDESIYGMQDIEHAARIRNVQYIKLKLKKIGSIDALGAALNRVRELGMRPVLGDGVATDIGCWMEACAASLYIDNAGEMNGFLKFQSSLFTEPMRMEGGSVVLPAGYRPSLSEESVQSCTMRSVSLA
jgi:L-alanine-DL-glutamate epimerase-like enolase superfamily enzyme